MKRVPNIRNIGNNVLATTMAIAVNMNGPNTIANTIRKFFSSSAVIGGINVNRKRNIY